MVLLNEICNYLDTLLSTHSITGDKSNNGLQIEGKTEIKRVLFSVDSFLELYQYSADNDVDLIITHHGESWGNGWKRITGVKAKRFTCLFRHQISLYAVHLPLDIHPELGHNVQIAEKISLCRLKSFAQYAGVDIGIYGDLAKPMTASILIEMLNACLDTRAVVYNDRGKSLKRVAIISGAGANAIESCLRHGIECLITGEFGHADYHILQESGIVLIAAGHYKTEVPGLLALKDHLQTAFPNLDYQFIDHPTGF